MNTLSRAENQGRPFEFTETVVAHEVSTFQASDGTRARPNIQEYS